MLQNIALFKRVDRTTTSKKAIDRRKPIDNVSRIIEEYNNKIRILTENSTDACKGGNPR